MNTSPFGPLRATFGDRLLTAGAELSRFDRDAISEEGYSGMPDAVVYPESTDEVVELVNFARERRIPLVPRGGGSGLSGGAVPVAGGIVVAMERMNRVIEIDTANLVAVLEPGVVTKELDSMLVPHGLFFAGYPMSEEICQIGGNVAENAGGGRAVKYGVTGDYVLGLEVVTAAGKVLRLGGRRVKDVTGYDLISLFVGSEGTLGIVTQVSLRLLPRPAARAVALGFLDDESRLAKITPALLALPARPSAVEFADAVCMRLLSSLSAQWRWVPSGTAMLLVELDGPDAGRVASERDDAAALMESFGAVEIGRSSTDADYEKLWLLRKQVPWALMKKSPHQTMEDITVPIAGTWPLIAGTRETSRRRGVEIANFGHLGDGNIHVTPLKPDGLDVGQWHEELPDLQTELYRLAASLGGTISGEHGIGHKRRAFLPLVLGEAELETMRAVKRALDPLGIMNPGKAV